MPSTLIFVGGVCAGLVAALVIVLIMLGREMDALDDQGEPHETD